MTRKNTFKQPPRAAFQLSLPSLRITELFVSATIVAFTVILLAVISIGVFAAYKKITSSSYFSLANIQIQGNIRLTQADVLAAAGINQGTNSFSIRLDEVEARLYENPWVREVKLKRVLPSSLEITLLEHEPRFWIMVNGVLHYADSRGTPIAVVSPGRLLSLPTLHMEQGADRYRALLPSLLTDIEEGRLSLPGTALAWIRLSLVKGIECKLENVDMIINLGIENYAANAARVALVLTDLERRGEKHRVQNIHAAGANVWISRRVAKAS